MSKILLIEPDYRLRKLYGQQLAEEHQVVVVSGAQQAILVTESFMPDVIVLEPQLPGHNGIEFLYELRSYDDLQTTPVIIFTALPVDLLNISRDQQTQLHISQIIKKQAGTAELRNSLQKTLQRV